MYRLAARLPTLLAAGAAALAWLGALAALLDSDLVPLGVPVAVLLAVEACMAAAFALVPPAGRWSRDRRDAARVVVVVGVVVAPVVLGLAAVATACACTGDGVDVLLLGIPPQVWIALGAVGLPALLGAASVPASVSVPPPVAAPERSSD
jgi:hypothetical protein